MEDNAPTLNNLHASFRVAHSLDLADHSPKLLFNMCPCLQLFVVGCMSESRVDLLAGPHPTLYFSQEEPDVYHVSNFCFIIFH